MYLYCFQWHWQKTSNLAENCPYRVKSRKQLPYKENGISSEMNGIKGNARSRKQFLCKRKPYFYPEKNDKKSCKEQKTTQMHRKCYFYRNQGHQKLCEEQKIVLVHRKDHFYGEEVSSYDKKGCFSTGKQHQTTQEPDNSSRANEKAISIETKAVRSQIKCKKNSSRTKKRLFL